MPQGCFIQCVDESDAKSLMHDINALLAHMQVQRWVSVDIINKNGRSGLMCVMHRHTVQEKLPEFNTLPLRQRFQLNLYPTDQALSCEVLLAMFASPCLLSFPSYAEFLSAQNMRCAIAQGASKTSMAFHTDMVDRPLDYWSYTEETGFTLRPGASLIEALRVTTQPDLSGRLYGFSCYRATEYVILLAIAQEARKNHPELLSALEKQWQQKAVMSGKFHDVFLREYGSNDAPLPMRWFVPGDRVWFRNPDDASSDVPGYEGSWVIYLGDGHFANFWRPDQPYDLVTKCLEIYHWRHGVFKDAHNTLRMDEEKVERLVASTKRDPEKTKTICERMMRLRDPQGIYAEGGCMDNTRESPKWVLPQTIDITLPDAPLASHSLH